MHEFDLKYLFDYTTIKGFYEFHLLHASNSKKLLKLSTKYSVLKEPYRFVKVLFD